MEKLTPWLIEYAYSQGAFPMGDESGDIAWYLPDPRAILPLDNFHASRSLRKSARRYAVTFDACYAEVMLACANRESTWITEEFVQVYSLLHERGNGHSAEAWHEGRLVGGVYGVAFGSAFFAESMFHTERDAGKVALWKLVEWLRARNFVLFEVQFLTEHLASLGAIEISHKKYMKLLNRALSQTPLPAPKICEPPLDL